MKRITEEQAGGFIDIEAVWERYRIEKPEHGSAAWLEARYWDENKNVRISASPAACLYGLHPFVKSDAYAAELLAGVPPQPAEANWAMKRGTDLEPVIAQWVIERTGIAFDTPDEMFICNTPGGGRLIATLDLFYEDETQRIVGEIKSRNRPWEGELPDYWRIQGIHQAICADVNEILWAVFDSSMELHLHIQPVTQAEKDEHVAAVESWLTNIDLGMTPSGVHWSYETIAARFPEPAPESVELPQSAADLVAQLRHVRSELKSYEDLEDQLKAALCEMIGNAEVATLDGVTVATWKGQTRQRFDQKSFVDQNPDLAKKYTKQVQSRTFLLKGERK